jgi:hypothetical protein
MEKRIFLFLTFTALIAGGLSGQSNFISIEPSLVLDPEGGFGLDHSIRYERVLTRYFSLSAYASVNLMIGSADFISRTDVEIAAAGRWYPFGRRFFTELGLAGIFYWDTYKEYTAPSYTNSYTSSSPYETVTDTYFGFGIIPGIGWTIDVGKPGRMFLSPGVKFPIAITKKGTRFSAIIFFGVGFAW